MALRDAIMVPKRAATRNSPTMQEEDGIPLSSDVTNLLRYGPIDPTTGLRTFIGSKVSAVGLMDPADVRWGVDITAGTYVGGDTLGTYRQDPPIIYTTPCSRNGKLYDKVADLQVRTRASDDGGGFTKTWTVVRRRIPCALDLISGDRKIENRQDKLYATHTLFCAPLSLTPKTQRFVIGGVIYTIKSEWTPRDHHMEIDLEESTDAA